MNRQVKLCSMIILLVMSAVTTDASACGVFKFDTLSIIGGVLFIQEKSSVNITFTVLTRDCVNTNDHITIFKLETTMNIPMIQCKIHQTCFTRRAIDSMSCQCLDAPGHYAFTFIADRNHSGKYMFSVENTDIPDAFLTFNITYPSQVTRLEIVGYDSCIPKHKFVTVVCTWENGNPPSRVKLIDRHDVILEKGDTTGNISFTFSPVECKHAGVIRCEADGSDRNISKAMLIECPPELVKNNSGIENLNIDPNADVTFPFRSHTSNISSCHINQITQKGNAVTNKFITVVLKCTKVIINASTFIHKNKHCLYSVTGEPPDLLLTTHVRNMTSQDNGLWYLTISNDEGSDEIYIQITIEDGSNPNGIEVNRNQGDVIVGVTSTVVVVLFIGYFLKKGKHFRVRFWKREEKEIILQKSLDTGTVEQLQRQSEIYYEIPDELQRNEIKTQQCSMIINDLYSASRLPLVHGQTMNMDQLRDTCKEYL